VVNAVLGNPKTGLTGSYHTFKFAKYAHRYLAEFRCRFNRCFDLRSILSRLVHVLASPGLAHWSLCAAEPCRESGGPTSCSRRCGTCLATHCVSKTWFSWAT
jgi:hypothetical protein